MQIIRVSEWVGTGYGRSKYHDGSAQDSIELALQSSSPSCADVCRQQ